MYVQKKYSQFPPTQQGKRIQTIMLAITIMIWHSPLYPMENNGRGVKAIGMANAFVAVADDIWAMNYNPAGLAQLHKIECSAFMVPYQFGMSELRTIAFGVAVPFSIASAALKLERFGFDLYKETEFGIAISGNYDENIYGGFTINFHRLDIAQYGSLQNIILDGGVLACIIKSVRLGFCMHNITGSIIGNQGEKSPQQCALGICCSLTSDLLMSVEIEKDIRYPANIKWGVEQKLIDILALRMGVANNPEKYSAGLSIKHSFFEFGYAGYSHVDLGWTHQIEVSFQFND